MLFKKIHTPHMSPLKMLRALMLAAVCAVAPASCSDSGDVPEGDGGAGSPTEVDAGFVITLSSGGVSESASRAPSEPDGGYDPGAGYENYIDIDGGDFRFLFFDKDNRYTGTFDVTTIEPLSQTPTSKRYYVAGNVAKNLIDGKELKVVALANWRTYDYETSLTAGVTTIDDVCSQIYRYDDVLPEGEDLSAANIIPLYGVTNLMTLTPSTTNRVDLGQINLLRALAKIEVIRATDGLELESVRLQYFNTSGYNAPRGVYTQDQYVHGDYGKDYTAAPSIVPGPETPNGTADRSKLRPFVKAGTDRWVLYVPEFDNINETPSRRARLLLRFKYMNQDDVVEFKDYSDGGKVFDIMRNYWYRFTVRKNAVTVQVVPYSEVLLSPIFGLGNKMELVEMETDMGLFYYDRNTGKFYDEKMNEVANPYFQTTDPLTGWNILRDRNNLFLCYYDGTAGVYYAADKQTRILPPNENALIDDPDMLMVIDAGTRISYYIHNQQKSELYANDRTTRIQNPFERKNAVANRIPYISIDASKTYGWYDLTARKWYDSDKADAKEIAYPF